MVNVYLKRAYDAAENGDGARVLVDRLWPRGVKKEDLALRDWVKDLAPSPSLRQWFDHDPNKWNEFRRNYLKELKDQKEQARRLLDSNEKGRLTLIYAAKDREHNHARVLREYLGKLDQ